MDNIRITVEPSGFFVRTDGAGVGPFPSGQAAHAWISEQAGRARKATGWSTAYWSRAEGHRDKEQLGELHTALNAAKATVRQDECGLWTIRGKRGYISTWGDDKTWHIITGGRGARHWNNIKRRLEACGAVITQDGHDEGCARLMLLPNAEQAAEIRDIVGIIQTRTDMPEGKPFRKVIAAEAF